MLGRGPEGRGRTILVGYQHRGQDVADSVLQKVGLQERKGSETLAEHPKVSR